MNLDIIGEPALIPVPGHEGLWPAFNAPALTTGGGTPYLQKSGVTLIAQTRTNVENLEAFLGGFEEGLGFEDYLEDDPLDSDAEQLAKTAGQLCYFSFGPNRTKNDQAPKYFDNIKQQKHGSVLEHPNFSFLFYGVSRSFTHELVRHRAGFGFSQVSQRYVSGKTLRFVERPEFQKHDVLHERFCARVDSLAKEYDEVAGLLMESMAKQLASMAKTEARKAVNQAARAVLPNETEAPVIVTANVRAWRHFCEMRGSKHAEPEIRSVAAKTLRCLSVVAPTLFSDYKAREMDDGSFEIWTDYSKV
jgi:thymidylate synthase (FAD)